MFLCLLQFFIIHFLIPDIVDEAEQNIFHLSVCHEPNFTLGGFKHEWFLLTLFGFES